MNFNFCCQGHLIPVIKAIFKQVYNLKDFMFSINLPNNNQDLDILQLITKQRSNLSEECYIHQWEIQTCPVHVAFNNNGKHLHK